MRPPLNGSVVRRICGRRIREPNVADAVSPCVKPIGVVVLGVAFSHLAQGADTRALKPITGATADVRSRAPATGDDSGVNLIIGRRIEVRDVERKPKPGTWLLDAEFFLRYEVLQIIFGSYQKKEISFASYVHFGRPPFLDHEYGLMYVSKVGDRWVQQKYLFQPVYPTADGRWAGCGDPYDGGYIHGSGVKAEPIKFKHPVVFDILNVPEFVRERKYPLPLFRYENETAVCLMGNYPDALFRVMKEGFLTARGVFPRP